MQRRPLAQVLAEGGGRMTPEQLFEDSGIGEDLIDDFYAELKREATTGRVEQRTDDGRVYLMLGETTP